MSHFLKNIFLNRSPFYIVSRITMYVMIGAILYAKITNNSTSLINDFQTNANEPTHIGAPGGSSEAEFYTDSILVKVKKTSKNKVKESDPNQSAIKAIKNLSKNNKLKKIDKLARLNNKTSPEDDDLFSWYQISLNDTGEKVKGKYDKASGKLTIDNAGKGRVLIDAISELRSDPDVDVVEPNYAVTITQSTFDTDPPTAPGNLSGIALSPTSIQLQWQPATDGSGVIAAYSVYRNGVLQYTDNILSWIDNTVAPTSTYSYYVTATDNAGNQGPSSNSILVSTPIPHTPTPTPSTGPDTQPPTAPSDLTATTLSPAEIRLQWGAATDNTGIGLYNIYRNGVSAVQGNVLTWTDTGRTPNTTYSYYVIAQDLAGNTGPASNIATATTTDATPTPTPSISTTIYPAPNDPYYNSTGSWGQSYEDLWGIHKVNPGPAWLQTTGDGTGVIIASIDTGIDRNHADLLNNMWINEYEIPANGIDDDVNGFIDDRYGWNFLGNTNNSMDDHGHGTHTAGTMAAVGNNALGVVGMVWRSKIMAIKMLGADGFGTMAAGAQSIQYATDMGAKVINNSWGCACQSAIVEDALQYANSHGVTVIASAGNSNANALDYSPASSQHVITVAAIDINDQAANWGGPATNFGEKIDVAAPGSYILSTKSAVNNACNNSTIGTYYCLMQGTSMAAPHVAGLAALVVNHNPLLTNEQIRQIIRVSAADLGMLGKDNVFGFGRIDAGAAMEVSDQSVIAPIISYPASRAYVSGSFSVYGTAAGQDFASYKVEVGSGRTPTAWSTYADSSTPVTNGILASSIPAGSGSSTIRLTVTGSNGKSYQYQVFDIQLLPSSSPTPSSTPTLIPTATNTPVPTSTPVPTATFTPSPTNTPVPTLTFTPTPTPDLIGPTVSITFPRNNAVLKRNSSITLQASAADFSGVSKVEFYVNNVLKCADTTPGYTCVWKVPNAKAVYSIRATAFDIYNNFSSHTITTSAK